MTLAAVLFAAGQQIFAADLTLKTQKRVLKEGTVVTVVEEQKWDPKKTAIVICDMWDKHWCKGATARVAEMAPAMDKVLRKAREQGVTIFHAPSSCMGPYGDHPARKRAVDIKADPEVLKILGGEKWCHGLPTETDAKWPIDQGNGGCDCEPKCPGGSPWRSQIDTLSIDPDKDFITDSGVAIGSYCRQNGINNVIVMGVHTNMCVIGRPFGLRQQVRLGNNTALMRDMTDTMYDSRSWPKVSHFKGTDLIVEHFERYICPSVLSTDFTGEAAPFKFKAADEPGKGK
jgi:nicotinamidase-related amidase